MPAEFKSPGAAQFTFSAIDRGRIENVDLLVAGKQPPPDVDTDGDGMPDTAELIAGTDPLDPNSIFKAKLDLEATPGGGLIISWSSVPGKRYAVSRSEDLAKGFLILQDNIQATAPTTIFRDATALSLGPYFYRIQVE